MKTIAKGNGFTISSSFGTAVAEGTLQSKSQGGGQTLTFNFTQKPVDLRTVFVEIVPVKGQPGDFWDTFWSNKVGGEPADQFALSTFVSVEPNGTFSVTLNADTAQESDETFEVRIYESNMDSVYGYAPLLSGRFTILNDDIVGTTGADSLTGRNHAEMFRSHGGNDTLVSNGGNDTLDGGTGADRMTGGTGDDTYLVDNSGDKVIEVSKGGTDTVRSSVSFGLSTNVENLILTGSANTSGTGNASNNQVTGNGGNNRLEGFLGNDTLGGGSGNDSLFGGAGSDRLLGGSGTDWLESGQGKDWLAGGIGADRFVFSTKFDSGTTTTTRDIITDFKRNQGDHIDLKAMDASTKSGGNQAFKFIGDDDFSGSAGQLRYDHLKSLTIVFADLNGDKLADFTIEVSGQINFSAHDFFL